MLFIFFSTGLAVDIKMFNGKSNERHNGSFIIKKLFRLNVRYLFKLWKRLMKFRMKFVQSVD